MRGRSDGPRHPEGRCGPFRVSGCVDVLFRVRAGRGRATLLPRTGTPRSVGRTAVPVDSVVRPLGEAADERQLVRRRANPRAPLHR
ncbi:hypothetical protein GCM10018966_010170 [Streptomyces yanii]